MKIYTAYDPPPGVGLDCSKDKDWTRQSEAAACDVNKIVAKFQATGILPQARADGVFTDVSMLTDYRDALEQVRKADVVFMSYPAEIREKFDNDPAKFLDYVLDPVNEDGMREMGLLPPKDVSAAAEPPA